MLIGTALACVSAGGPASDLRTPARTASARCSTRSRSAGNNNGSAFAGLGANSSVLQHCRRACDAASRRYLADRPGAGDRRLAGAKKIVPAGAGTLPTHTPLFVGLLVGTVIAGRSADLHSRAGAGADRRTSADDRQLVARTGHFRNDYDRLFDPQIRSAPAVRCAIVRRALSTRSRSSIRAVRSATRSCSWSESAALLTTLLCACRRWLRHGRGSAPASSSRSRSGSGSRCCSPTSPKRWPRGAARRRPTRCARRAATCTAKKLASRSAMRPSRRSSQPDAAQGRRRAGRGGRLHSRRRRGGRRRRLGRRERHHRRERAGDPRERRRPQRRHRRHARALRLAGRAHHGESRRDLSRPHDRDGRRRQAPEDAQRDRARTSCWPRSRSSSCWRR